jgi:hypothetical protein
MPARTYSTDVCLTCPCAHCEGREVQAQVSESLTTPPASMRPSRAPARVGTQQPGNSKAKPGSPNAMGKHPAGASAAK